MVYTTMSAFAIEGSAATRTSIEVEGAGQLRLDGDARVGAAEEVGLRPLAQPKAVKPLSGAPLEGMPAA